MQSYLAVALGGMVGCCARYGMTQLVQAVYGRNFPLATLTINVLGAFLMGFLFFETLDRLTINPLLRTAILTGGLGGFTTFSTFMVESLLLVEDGQPGKAVLYLSLSIVLGLVAVFAGALIARNL